MNAAEGLMDIAKNLTGLFVAEVPFTDTNFAIVKLALKLKQKPKLALRAMVEDWKLTDIVREVY